MKQQIKHICLLLLLCCFWGAFCNEDHNSSSNMTDDGEIFVRKPQNAPPAFAERVIEAVGSPNTNHPHPNHHFRPKDSFDNQQPPRRPVYDGNYQPGYGGSYGGSYGGYGPQEGYYDGPWSSRGTGGYGRYPGSGGGYRPSRSNGYYGPSWSVPASPEVIGYPVGVPNRGYGPGATGVAPGYGYPDYGYGNRGVPSYPSTGGGYGGYGRPAYGYGVSGATYG